MCVALAVYPEARVLVHQTGERTSELVSVGLCLRRDRNVVDRFREVERREGQSGFPGGQRVAGRGGRELCDGADVARRKGIDVLAVLARQNDDLCDAFLLSAVGVPNLLVALEHAGVDPKEGELADEGVRCGLEDERTEGAVSLRSDFHRLATRRLGGLDGGDVRAWQQADDGVKHGFNTVPDGA